MGQHAKFNREEVIAKATNLYWEKGFHGTSMRNLQAAVDMRPGSLYATFGSKENLFRESILHYAANFDLRLQQCLNQASSPLSALKLFIRKATIDNRKTAPSGMCMLVKTVAELTEEQAELLTEAKNQLSRVETEFAKVFQMAIDAGEMQPNKDPKKLARYFQVQVMGLRTYAWANNDDITIEQLIDDLFTSSYFT